MKKMFIIAAVTFCMAAMLYAQDDSTSAAETETMTDALTQASNRKPNVKVGVSIDVKDKNYIYTKGENTETNKQLFDRYRNKAAVQGSALININDRVTVSPYLRVHDMDFKTFDIEIHERTDENTDDIVSEKHFRFDSGALKIGTSLSAAVTDFFSVTCNLFQWDYFKHNDFVWAGLGYSMALDFSIEQIFLDISLWDEVSVRFCDKDNKTNSLLLNLFDYGFRFNFLNFAKPGINTGIYASGEFELDCSAVDGAYKNNYLYNEIYIGIKSSPLPFLSFWASYFVQAECDWNADFTRVAGKGAVDMGLETGISFQYNGFSASFSYEPHLYRVSDAGIDKWKQSPITQSISLTLGYKFKTYFAKK